MLPTQWCITAYAEWEGHCPSRPCTFHVLNAHLPIEPDKSNRNDNAEVATMQSDMSEEVIGTPDLDEARVVYEKLVDGTVTVVDVCESDVLNRIKDRLHKHAVSAKMSSRTGSLLGSVHGHGRFPSKVHYGRAHWKLGITFANHPEHASLPGSLGPQPVH